MINTLLTISIIIMFILCYYYITMRDKYILRKYNDRTNRLERVNAEQYKKYSKRFYICFIILWGFIIIIPTFFI